MEARHGLDSITARQDSKIENDIYGYGLGVIARHERDRHGGSGMSHYCQGRCKAIKVSCRSPYGKGLGRCGVCEAYMEASGPRCPCCGERLRMMARVSLCRQKAREVSRY